MEDKEVKYDYNKEVKNLLTEQIKRQNEIIDILLKDKESSKRLTKTEIYSIVSLAAMIFLICMAFILSYFFGDYEVSTVNNNNTNTNSLGGDYNGN